MQTTFGTRSPRCEAVLYMVALYDVRLPALHRKPPLCSGSRLKSCYWKTWEHTAQSCRYPFPCECERAPGSFQRTAFSETREREIHRYTSSTEDGRRCPAETEARTGTCLKYLIHAGSFPSSEPCSGWADDGQGGCHVHHFCHHQDPSGVRAPHV